MTVVLTKNGPFDTPQGKVSKGRTEASVSPSTWVSGTPAGPAWGSEHRGAGSLGFTPARLAAGPASRPWNGAGRGPCPVRWARELMEMHTKVLAAVPGTQLIVNTFSLIITVFHTPVAVSISYSSFPSKEGVHVVPKATQCPRCPRIHVCRVLPTDTSAGGFGCPALP